MSSEQEISDEIDKEIAAMEIEHDKEQNIIQTLLKRIQAMEVEQLRQKAEIKRLCYQLRIGTE